MTSPETVSADVALVADPALGRAARDVPPDDWASRALYLGDRGAENWLAVSHSSAYALCGGDPFDLHKNRLAAIADLHPATYVSLGAGDGSDDVELLTALARHGRRAAYLPVDISHDLLQVAVGQAGPRAEIPAAVVGDFEAGQAFLADAIRRHARPPVLFGLLGGTVGNLDLGEANFFDGLKAMMTADDRLLVDIPLYGAAWTPELEPRLDAGKYTEEFRMFLAGAATRLSREAAETRFHDDFAHCVDLVLDEDATASAKTIRVFDVRNRRLILTFKRFDWTATLDWLGRQGFEIAFAECSVRSEADVFGMGVVLLSAAGHGQRPRRAETGMAR